MGRKWTYRAEGVGTCANKHGDRGWKYSCGTAACSPGSPAVSSSVQVEQAKNDLDLDQDADLAYNSLKVSLSADEGLELSPSGA